MPMNCARSANELLEANERLRETALRIKQVWMDNYLKVERENERLKLLVDGTAEEALHQASLILEEKHDAERALAVVRELLQELWANDSVRAAVGEGDPQGLYRRVESATSEPHAEEKPA